MSMAKQIFYHNLRKGNKIEQEIYNKDIKPYVEKNDIAYWSSETFLHEYFLKCEFSEPYAKAWGSIPQAWVTTPWRNKMKKIIFKFVRDYLKSYKKLPEGKFSFLVDWESSDFHWLKKCLKKKQSVIFPKTGFK